MIALDASVLIGFLDGADPHHSRAEEALIAHADERFCASTVTLAEVLVGPARQGAAQAIRDVFAALEIAPVEVGAGDELALADLRARTTTKLPDCCVLLAARREGAGVLSFDATLRRAASEVGIAVADG